MFKHVREKCGKLDISSILSSKRGITPAMIDENRWRLNFFLGLEKKVRYKISTQYVEVYWRKNAENCIYLQ